MIYALHLSYGTMTPNETVELHQYESKGQLTRIWRTVQRNDPNLENSQLQNF